jgi:hypothetical protein
MLSKAALQEWISIALMSPGIPVYVTCYASLSVVRLGLV